MLCEERRYAETCGKYYTYIHVTGDNAGFPGRIFYVGKGKKDRAWVTDGRNVFWTNMFKKHGRSVTICSYWDTEDEAHEHERILISCLRDIGESLVNMTDGGEGSSGHIPSREANIKRSKSLRDTLANEHSRFKKSQAGLKTWADPEIAARRTSGIKAAVWRSDVREDLLRRLSKIRENEEIQARRSFSIKASWADPVARSKRLDSAWNAENKARHLASVRNEEWRSKQAQGLKKWYSDPSNLERKAAFIRERDGTRVRCIEANVTFASIALASLWLRENGHPKARRNGIGAALQRASKFAYGYHWEFA